MSTAAATITSPIGMLELLGPIVRLQVQVASLKVGTRPRSGYTPEPIRSVPALRLDDGGVTGLDGGDVADVHHRVHPQSRHRGENGISIGFTGHYAAMRERYPHLTDGIAGENILVEHAAIHDEPGLGDRLVIATAGGHVLLTDVQHAPPCVEFGKFCNGYPIDQRADAVIAETVRFLGNGLRGFYGTLAIDSRPVTVTIGDLVYRLSKDEVRRVV